MKLVRRMLALLALCISTTASAQLPVVPSVACIPYSIPIPQSVVSCGAGMQGTKFKTSIKECPSGKVTESAQYDMSACVAAPTTSGGYMSTDARCRFTPDGCASTPAATGCLAGYHWTTLGSGVAHCVKDDFTCPWGQSLTHDKTGNPSCKQNTCPATQVLQADGQSCACPANMVLSGSTCIFLPPANPPAPPMTYISSSTIHTGWSPYSCMNGKSFMTSEKGTPCVELGHKIFGMKFFKEEIAKYHNPAIFQHPDMVAALDYLWVKADNMQLPGSGNVISNFQFQVSRQTFGSVTATILSERRGVGGLWYWASYKIEIKNMNY